MGIGLAEVLIVLLIFGLPAYLVGKLASKRGQSFWPIFLLALVVLWPVALVVVLLRDGWGRGG